MKGILRLLFLIVFGFSNSLQAGELPTPNSFGGNFSFDSTLGKKASISDWQGKVVLINFGFTSCPDVCPLVLSKLSLVKSLLEKDADQLQVVFVTVDPERDSIEKMQVYLENFHSSFVGMRGSHTEYPKVLQRYGASSQQHKTGGSVEVSHTDYVYVLNKQGHVAGFYDVKTNYKEVLAAVKKLL